MWQGHRVLHSHLLTEVQGAPDLGVSQDSWCPGEPPVCQQSTWWPRSCRGCLTPSCNPALALEDRVVVLGPHISVWKFLLTYPCFLFYTFMLFIIFVLILFACVVLFLLLFLSWFVSSFSAFRFSNINTKFINFLLSSFSLCPSSCVAVGLCVQGSVCLSGTCLQCVLVHMCRGVGVAFRYCRGV